MTNDELIDTLKKAAESQDNIALKMLLMMAAERNERQHAALYRTESQPEQKYDYRIKYDRPCCKCLSNFCPGNCKEPEHLTQPVDTVNISQERVTLLPDGSAFGVMSFPLPESHWLYAERQYREGEYEPIELGKPILTRELKSAVVSAMRYAIRAATNCGKEMDFDPDAIVLNAVYALCGPYTTPVDTVNTSKERADETAKGEQEPVAYKEECWACGCEECICATKVPGYYESKIKEAVLAEREAVLDLVDAYAKNNTDLAAAIRARGEK